MSSPEGNDYSEEMFETLERWAAPIEKELDYINHIFYQDQASYQYLGDYIDEPRLSIFKTYPALSRCGMGLIIKSPVNAYRNDLLIQVNKNNPDTFDVLILETEAVQGGRASRQITNPALRKIMESAPDWSSMALDRYSHFAFVNKAHVQPENIFGGALTRSCVNSWDITHPGCVCLEIGVAEVSQIATHLNTFLKCLTALDVHCFSPTVRNVLVYIQKKIARAIFFCMLPSRVSNPNKQLQKLLSYH